MKGKIKVLDVKEISYYNDRKSKFNTERHWLPVLICGYID